MKKNPMNKIKIQSWILKEGITLAPTSTTTIRVRLISTRNAGTNNDGYFDSLSVVALGFMGKPKNQGVSFSSSRLFHADCTSDDCRS